MGYPLGLLMANAFMCNIEEKLTPTSTCGGTQAIYNRYHVKDERGKDPETTGRNFDILKKRQSKLDCLIFEMLFIRNALVLLNSSPASFLTGTSVPVF